MMAFLRLIAVMRLLYVALLCGRLLCCVCRFVVGRVCGIIHAMKHQLVWIKAMWAMCALCGCAVKASAADQVQAEGVSVRLCTAC